MKMITTGNLTLPALGLGTYKLTGQEGIRVIATALDIGYRLIDTAQLYHNEEEVGQALFASAIPREQLFVITKVWPSNFSADRFIPSVKTSLKKLRMEYVELLLIHWPHGSLQVSQYIDFLQECKHLGLAKEIGVSNYNIVQLEEAKKCGATIVVNEIEYHPWIDQHLLLEWMNAHTMPVIAYCPLGRGILLTDESLQQIANHHHKKAAQVVLRWHIQKANCIAIPKASTRIHLEENLIVFDFELSDAEMQVLDAFHTQHIRVVGAQPGAEWD